MATYPKSNFSIAVFLAVILAIAVSALPSSQSDDFTNVPVSLSIQPETSLDTADSGDTETHGNEKANWHIQKVKTGDSLSSIFQRAGLTAAELQQVMSLGKVVSDLVRIMPGQELHFLVNDENQLNGIKYFKNQLTTLNIERNGDNYQANWLLTEPEINTSFKSAVISKSAPSLFHAGKRANISDKLIMNLANIFQWDISFALDMRVGDRFTIVYEEKYIEGEKVSEGDILAAQFTNMGKTYTAVRFEDKSGFSNYFTPEGESLRKAFLRDPVHFSRISDSFNLRRMHPVVRKVKPHRGIDYAAVTGTPVYASGDGKVKFARRNQYSGKHVVIQHGQQFTTKYLHLSRYGKGIRSGKKVKQGQIIGYVGATGRVTGAHLHYEFLVNGVHRNPRTVKLPNAAPIDKKQYSAFRNATSPLITQLAALTQGQNLASASDD